MLEEIELTALIASLSLRVVRQVRLFGTSHEWEAGVSEMENARWPEPETFSYSVF